MQYFASVQIITQQPYNRLLNNIFSYCRIGVWAAKFLFGRALPLLVAALRYSLRYGTVHLNACILRLNFLSGLAKWAKAPSPWLCH